MGIIYMAGMILILALLVAILGHVMYRWSKRHVTGMLTIVIAIVWLMLIWSAPGLLWVIIPALIIYGLLARYPYVLKAK
ncbi:hypothetical protein [Paenibacillus wulumuqiensis]|uniref:hypothetical protein n=1 Tax=Paenibacillus wulumuqiensis TaxID=1567107 RepID=UPI00061950F0|nr:hypothetical protein [Paenibacillus wulumuqiensis]